MKSLNGFAAVAAWGAIAVGGSADLSIAQTTWTVCPDGTCEFTSIQAAIDVASDGDTILLGPGEYDPIVIDGKSLVIVGTASRDQVTIDGHHIERPVRVTNVATSPGVRLERLTLTRGRVYSDRSHVRGGGLLASYSILELVDVEVTDCAISRDTGSTVVNGGGAIALEWTSAMIVDSSVSDSHVSSHVPTDTNATAYSQGGGIYALHSTLAILGCEIRGCSVNSSTQAGTWQNIFASGAGLAASNSTLTLRNCRIENNTAMVTNHTSGVAAAHVYGIGVYGETCSGEIDSCFVTANVGTVDSVSTWNEEYNAAYGGGVLLRSPSGTAASWVVSRCDIASNHIISGLAAAGRIQGGGLWLEGGNTTYSIADTSVRQNQMGSDSTLGSRSGGGIFASSVGSLSITNSVVCGNDIDPMAVGKNDVAILASCIAQSCSECPDCDADAVTDLVQVLHGAADCDDNLVPDHCEYDSSFFASSPTLSPVAYGFPQETTFAVSPTATSAVRLRFEVIGDLGSPSEFLTITTDSQTVGLLFALDGSDCPDTSMIRFIDIEPAQFNALAVDGTLEIGIYASQLVSEAECPDSRVRVTLGHVGDPPDCNGNEQDDRCDIRGGGSLDCDHSGVPDECEVLEDCDSNSEADACEIALDPSLDKNMDGRLDACSYLLGDFDLSGVIDGTDLSYLLAVWGEPNPPVGDLNGDGVVGGADLAILLGHWGPIEGS